MLGERENKANLRRQLILGGACALLLPKSSLREPLRDSEFKFPDVDPSKLGVSANLESARFFGFDEWKALENHMELPLANFRFGARFEKINPFDGVYDFRSTDGIVNKAIQKNKRIELVMGMKTPGFPEVRIPSYLYARHPYLAKAGPLDREQEVRDKTLEYLERTWDRYKLVREIHSVHLENEGLLQLLNLSKQRYVTHGFYEQELDVIQRNDPYNRMNVQNPPWDKKIEEGFKFLRNPLIDVVALNIYNNAAENKGLWPGTTIMKYLGILANKIIKVSEYQSAFWIKEKNQPEFDFSWSNFSSGLERLLELGFEVDLWDLEQRYALEESGDEGSIKFLKWLRGLG